MNKTNEDYFLGLDIGTDSVGFAVTNTKYQLQKIKGKHLWGIRLFEEGKVAEKRRTFRASRRRLEREKERIRLLQEFFVTEINKIDKDFF